MANKPADRAGLWNGTPPHIAVLTPGHPNNVTPGAKLIDLDLSNKIITPDTAIGFGDLPLLGLKLTLFDINMNPLPLDGLYTEHFTIDYTSQTSTVIADRKVLLDPDTGIMAVGPHHDGGNYPESGLTLFTNLPPQTASMTVTATVDGFGDFVQFYLGDGALGEPIDPVFLPTGGYVEADRLILPVVTVDDVIAFSIELTLEPGTAPPIVLLTYAQELSSWDPTDASFVDLDTLVLTAVKIEINGQYFWGQFNLIQENPFRFKLFTAGIDDDDDDDDGIPDDQDPFPYQP